MNKFEKVKYLTQHNMPLKITYSKGEKFSIFKCKTVEYTESLRISWKRKNGVSSRTFNISAFWEFMGDKNNQLEEFISYIQIMEEF